MNLNDTRTISLLRQWACHFSDINHVTLTTTLCDMSFVRQIIEPCTLNDIVYFACMHLNDCYYHVTGGGKLRTLLSWLRETISCKVLGHLYPYKELAKTTGQVSQKQLISRYVKTKTTVIRSMSKLPSPPHCSSLSANMLYSVVHVHTYLLFVVQSTYLKMKGFVQVHTMDILSWKCNDSWIRKSANILVVQVPVTPNFSV